VGKNFLIFDNFRMRVATASWSSHGRTCEGKRTMTSRTLIVASAHAHRQGFHGQEHPVGDRAINQTVNARVVPD
jgi:hypothetical protein